MGMARRSVPSLLAALVLGATALPAPATAKASTAVPRGRSMWVWYLAKSDGGSVPAIVARARAAGVSTLIVKSADGASYWSQFTSRLVAELRASGLQVCAWQYVYGVRPVAEADLGARAAAAGAQCLIIDAEAEYQGLYASAASYLHELRRLVGPHYPVGLASFPYVDYHPGFPYSVFLGPGGAQFDMPQMYWLDITGEISTVFRHTYEQNRIYRRTIYPVGQTYGSPTPAAVQLFRGLAVRYRAPGISWWDYAWTSAGGLWPAISGVYAPAGAPPLGDPLLGPGAKGDSVLWMQEHLAGEFPTQRATGLFASQTLGHLRAFQLRHRLPVTGTTDPATWEALLRLHPVVPAWGASATGARVGAGAPHAQAGPASASLPARRYEIPEAGSDHGGLGSSHLDP